MVNYNNSKIYRVVCSKTQEEYYGSTVAPISQRIRYYRKIENHVVSDFIKPKIFWIKDIPCESYEQQLSLLQQFKEEKLRSKPL